MTIRQLKHSDYSSWLALWAEYVASFDRHTVSDEITKSTWERLVSKDVNGLLVLDDQNAIGFAHFAYQPSTFMKEQICYVHDLAVTKSHRGRGIAQELFEAVFAEAAAAGMSRVYWHVNESNAQARRLYDRVASATGAIVYARKL